MQSDELTPELLARYYRFFHQKFEKKDHIVPFKLIRGKTFYKSNYKIFDKLFDVCKKYRIDPLKYMEFCINERGIFTCKDLININSFILYANNVKKKIQYSKIYGYVLKSAENVADYMISNGFVTPETALMSLIASNRLGYEMLSGRISKYYVASISNIKEISLKMDLQSRQELDTILAVSDALRDEALKSIGVVLNEQKTPFQITLDILNRKLKENK